MPGPDLLERIDRIMAELQAIRAEVAASLPRDAVSRDADDADDLADGNLLDTHAASARFGYPRDTIAKWCREENLGRRQGGRWLVDPVKLRQRINGG